jgi:hypothetical protein
MMKFIGVVILLLTFLSGLNAHAVLVVPAPWSTNPSKTSHCGGGNQPSIPAANFKRGATVTLTWKVVAGDGAGAVTAQFDTTGGQGFAAPVNMPLTGATPTAVGTFTFTGTVPSITCTGTNSTCTLNLFSSSAWFSCSTVQLTDTGSTGPPPPPTCVMPTTLPFCKSVDNQQILLSGGQKDPNAFDSSVFAAFNATRYNPAVFATPNAPGCLEAYTQFFCGFNYPLCSGAAPGCKNACWNTASRCGLLPAHVTLYDCDQYKQMDSDASGVCPARDNAASSVWISGAVMMMAVLALFL